MLTRTSIAKSKGQQSHKKETLIWVPIQSLAALAAPPLPTPEHAAKFLGNEIPSTPKRPERVQAHKKDEAVAQGEVGGQPLPKPLFS